MGMDRRLRYKQTRSLTEALLERYLEVSEEVGKLLTECPEKSSARERQVHALTQIVAEFTQVQIGLCMVALSVQELTDEVKAWRSDATDEE